MEHYVDSTEQLVVEMHVRNIKQSKEFYQRLGFQVVQDVGPFVVLAWEEHRLFLDERKDLPPLSDLFQANIRVMVPNVDNYWELVNEMGANIVRSIGNRAYGLRDFTIADPDGFCLRFGSLLPVSAR